MFPISAVVGTTVALRLALRSLDAPCSPFASQTSMGQVLRVGISAMSDERDEQQVTQDP